MKTTKKSAKRKVSRPTRRKSVAKNNINIEKNIFRGLFMLTIVSSVGYSLLLNQVVANVVGRKDINQEMVDISSEITELELSYIGRQNALDLTYALSHGFEQPTGASSYIVRGKTPVLTYSE